MTNLVLSPVVPVLRLEGRGRRGGGRWRVGGGGGGVLRGPVQRVLQAEGAAEWTVEQPQRRQGKLRQLVGRHGVQTLETTR